MGAWPKMDGRWPITSGLKFEFDPEKPKGDRIIASSMVLIDGRSLDMEEYYTVAVTEYMALGKDGFDAFLDKSVKHYSHGEEEIDIRQILNNFLNKLHWSIDELNKQSKHMK